MIPPAVGPPQIPCELIHRHGIVFRSMVLVVLVHIQHDDGVGQGEGCVCVRERIVVRSLKRGEIDF